MAELSQRKANVQPSPSDSSIAESNATKKEINNSPLKKKRVPLNSRRPREEADSKTFWLSCFVFAVLAIGGIIYYRNPKPPQYRKAYYEDGYKVIGKVPVVEWTPDKPFGMEIAKKRTPVILKNTVVETWKARKEWNPQYLIQNVELLTQVYEHNQNVFTFYDESKPFIKFEGVRKDLQASHKTVDLPPSYFFQKASLAAQNRTSSIFYYYSGPLKDFAKIEGDIDHLDYLFSNEGPSQYSSVWMGYNGTTAHTHYDIFNNFNVQLYGKKRFLLTSPSLWEKMYMYPRYHPSYRQSQVDFTAPDLTKFPLFQDIHALEATLEPGDVLYIPPYWGHRVTSLSLSISVNLFSESSETLIYYDIQKQILNFKNDLTTKLLLTKGLVEFLTEASLNSFKRKDPKEIVHQLFRSRYENLYKVLSVDANSFSFCQQEMYQKKEIPNLNDIHFTAKLVGKLFKSTPEPIRTISFENYIEDVTNSFLGDINIAEFLKKCWD